MGQPNESVVSQASINARAEALEKKEAEAAAGKPAEGEVTEPEKGADADAAAKAKADADKKAADEKAAADKKAAEEAEKGGQEKDPATGKFVSKKKQPNDPDELRKWSTRTSQENAKLRKEMAELKEAQEKTFKLLASLSKKPVDYKELAKDPAALEKFVEDERQSLTSEYQEQLEALATQAREKDTIVEKMRREQDPENYPRWKELYPAIVKIAVGPAGTGDPRVDFTKPASEVLDQLYEIAVQENPKSAEPPKPETPPEKTYTEAEVKAMVADMVAKEREVISKSAREAAEKEAQESLRREAAGSTVASAGKGAGRVPTDQLAAFKQMTIQQQRDWLIAQQNKQ